jgi:hypothetical protein
VACRTSSIAFTFSGSDIAIEIDRQHFEQRILRKIAEVHQELAEPFFFFLLDLQRVFELVLRDELSLDQDLPDPLAQRRLGF